MRIPRPLGLTSLSIQYRQDEDKKILEQMIQAYLTDYLQQGTEMSLLDVGKFLGISQEEVNRAMAKMAENVLERQGINTDRELARDLGKLCLKWALGDRYHIVSQFARLSSSQGDGYKPFVSSEVNKSLDLLLKSTKQMGDLFTQLGKPSISINNTLTNIQSDAKTTNYLTTETALELLENQPNPETTNTQNLFQIHNIADTPDIYTNAIQERNFEEDLVDFKKGQHEDRRVIELDIIDDEDNYPI